MICPNTGELCQYKECPMYIGYCLLAIEIKEKFNILSLEEKQLLTKLRKESIK